MLKVLCIVNGQLDENCYIVCNDNKALIIDPGSDDEKIYNTVDKLKLNVVGVLVTHYHFDHILCLDNIIKKYNVCVIDYKSKINSIDCFNFEVIKNYGHTMDSVSFYFKNEKIMFTGDFIFKNSIGKYENINENAMIESLKRFVKYDNDIVIYPGHGDSSTIGYEKENNYFLRGIK